MRSILSFITCFFIYVSSYAQPSLLTENNETRLLQIEDTLKDLSREMINNPLTVLRIKNDSAFVRTLVRALRVPHSFYFPFDSVETVSKLYAPDSAFRIFTWQFERDSNYFRQRGAIQMRTKDGSLQLYPLIDISDFTSKPTDSVRSGNQWIGAIYYNITVHEYNGKKYYTLLGFDDYSDLAVRKWIDVLTFDEQGKPQFGAPIFKYKPDSSKPAQPAYRFVLEYKKDGRAKLNYDKDLKLIIFDHLVSETNDPSKKFTLMPDGDYEAFRWQNGAWVHIPKLFNEAADMRGIDPLLGNAPKDATIRDASGKIDEQKLMEQSLQNAAKAKQAAEAEQKQKEEAAKKRKAKLDKAKKN